MNRPLLARPGVCIGLIALATLAVYIPAYRAGFIWNDDAYVSRNPTLHTVEGLRKIWFDTTATPQYSPVTFTSFWVENQLWGRSPTGYHVVNVVLHVVAAVLLWRVLTLLAVPGALFVAMLFALHPIQVESVAWIGERRSVLSAVFFMGALAAYLRWTKIEEPSPPARGPAKHLVLAIVLFACALLSHRLAAMLPAAILLVLWWRRGRVAARDGGVLGAMLVAGLTLALVNIGTDPDRIGAGDLDGKPGALDRVLIVGRAASFYVGKLVWPTNLSFIYPRWSIDPSQAFQFVFPLAVITVLAALFALRRQIGRGPVSAALYYAATLALGVLVPGTMRLSYVSDPLCYLACIGPLALIAAILASRFRGHAPLATGLSAVVLAVLGALTWRQCGAYQDAEALWRDTVTKYPDTWVAHSNLGSILFARGQFAEAMKEYSATAKIVPDFADAHYNLGKTLINLGRFDESEAEFQEALRLAPQFANARFSMGILRERQGRAEDAVAEYRATLEINAYYVPAYLNIANALIKQGRIEAALADLDSGLKVFGDKPDAALLHKAKGALFLAKGRTAEAMASLNEAARLAPTDAEIHLRLANAIFQSGKLDDAAVAYLGTLQLNPNLAQAHYNLAVIRLSQGIPQEAMEHFLEAVRLKPDYVDARFSVAQMFEAARRLDDAKREYQEVLRLSPKHPEARQRLEALLHPRFEKSVTTTSAPDKAPWSPTGR